MTSPKMNTTRNPRRKGRVPVTMSAAELNALTVYSVAEVTVLMRVCEDIIRAEIKRGTLHAEDYGSPNRPVYRIPRESLDRWRELRRVIPNGQK